MCLKEKMVSKASEDLPEPERPVNTTILLRGISTVIFLRLWVRAPLTIIRSSLFFIMKLTHDKLVGGKLEHYNIV